MKKFNTTPPLAKLGVSALFFAFMFVSNFSIAQNPTVISDSLVVLNRVYAKEKLIVDQEAKFKQDIKVLGNARIHTDLRVDGELRVDGGNLTLQFPEKITGDFERPLIFFQVYPADETFKYQALDTSDVSYKTEINLPQDSTVQAITQTNWRPNLTPLISVDIKPNPTSDFCFVHIETTSSQNVYWSLANEQGEILITNQKFSADFNLNLSNYTSGIYYLIIQNGEMNFTKKIIRL